MVINITDNLSCYSLEHNNLPIICMRCGLSLVPHTRVMNIIIAAAAALVWSAEPARAQSSTRGRACFSERVTRLVQCILMPEHQLRAIPQLLQDLDNSLSTRWPERQVILFGSAMTGLAMIGSDVDFIVILSNGTKEPPAPVQQVTAVLRQYPELFTDLVTYAETKVDVVSYRHVPTGMQVDVESNGLHEARECDLVRFLIHLDERVFNLAVVAKLWSKVHRIQNKKLSNYAVTLLLIFYLQQKDILPSIASLQRNATHHFLDNWKYGFENLDYQLHFDDSLYDLLGGFFEYYDHFEFNKYIISTFSGRPVPRTLFSNLKSVPDEYCLYKRNVKRGISRPLILTDTEMIIQNPFIHSVNLAKDFKSHSYTSFLAHVKFAAATYREKKESQFLNQILRGNHQTLPLIACL